MVELNVLEREIFDSTGETAVWLDDLVSLRYIGDWKTRVFVE